MKFVQNIFIICLFSASIINATPIKECNDGSIKQQDMNYCAQIEREFAENVLKDILNDVNNSIKSTEKKHIISGQKIWRTLTKIDCDIVSNLTKEGRESYMQVEGCQTAHIKQRIDNLISHICGGYGITCEEQDVYKMYLDSGIYNYAGEKKQSLFRLTDESAIAKVSQTSYVKALNKKYSNIIMYVDRDMRVEGYIYIYLGFDEKTHTTRNSMIRVDLEGKVESKKPSENSWKQLS